MHCNQRTNQLITINAHLYPKPFSNHNIPCSLPPPSLPPSLRHHFFSLPPSSASLPPSVPHSLPLCFTPFLFASIPPSVPHSLPLCLTLSLSAPFPPSLRQSLELSLLHVDNKTKAAEKNHCNEMLKSNTGFEWYILRISPVLAA